MKLKYRFALALGALAFCSCGDSFFEQYPSNNITEGNFYQTDDDFDQGVKACYSRGTDAALRSSGQHNVCVIILNGTKGIPDTVGSRRTCGYHVGAFSPKS